ncbi:MULTISPECIES: tripartite tricarboxylate transporter TctB family protein [Paracoccus]|uniref:Tripartite tricarboxylate transporter TctB family protein n=1 Tax=Paracoccus rhizosphaerae TaxID=1133347 RepID=A0ABV6CJP0_9RHOB|nr:tripartite tricarboxylate transporter TctB family protein [Paracoccus rhizosphaerae]MEC9102890.1 tripartite tricarboxylate transporter TctB family protein [Pseudomonadota bacterium]MEE2860929.1 tripartite tricarboxylate transporter TctB family protein [Pseudomonadota bacterium]
MTDRLAGACFFLLAAGYVWLSTGYTAGFGDPLGPAIFPRVIGIPAVLLGLCLMIWPRHNAAWAPADGLLRQGAALVILLGYALLLEPLGFVPSTFAAVLGLGLLMGAPSIWGFVTAAIAAPGLYLLFDRLMGLPLPVIGTWFG